MLSFKKVLMKSYTSSTSQLAYKNLMAKEQAVKLNGKNRTTKA